MPKTFAEVRPDLHIPEKVEAAVFKALSKDPSQRQPTMEELKKELLDALPGRGFVGTNSSKPKKSQLGNHDYRNRIVGSILVVAILCVAVLFVQAIMSTSFPGQKDKPTMVSPVKTIPVAIPTTAAVKPAAPVTGDSTHRHIDKAVEPQVVPVRNELPPKPKKRLEQKRQESALPVRTESRPTSSAVEQYVPAREARPKRRSNEDLFYDFQDKRENKFSKSHSWIPAVGGSIGNSSE